LGIKEGREGNVSSQTEDCRWLIQHSSNMIPKQHEMDGIVQRIVKAIESENHLQSTLFVLCGDHGMNDAGNHGASSPGETSPALVFISPKLKALQKKYQAPAPFSEDFQYYSTVEQSDIAPTLGALLGFPVPKNNLGTFIVDFLPFWSSRMLLLLCIVFMIHPLTR